MTPQPRPVGLTVLAVLAFLLAWGGAVSALDLFLIAHPPGSGPTSKDFDLVIPARAIQVGLGLLALLRVAMQVGAGIGLLRQSERLGRQLGNLWGAVSLLQLALTHILMQIRPTPVYLLSLLGGVATVGLVLALINGPFRRAFR